MNAVIPRGHAYISLHTLTGKFVAFEGAQPATFTMRGAAIRYLPCFSTKAALREIFARTEATFTDIREINDGLKFAQQTSLLSNVVVILDPHYTSDGRVLFGVLARATQ